VEVAEERGQRGSEQSPAQRAHPGARLRPVEIEDEHRLAGRRAVGEAKVLVVDVVAAQRNSQQHAEQTGHREPAEDLQRREMHREAELGPRVEHVHRRQDDAHESRLARCRPRRLHQVVLPPRAPDAGEKANRAQGQVAEEGADHRNVRAVADLQHDVRVGAAHDGGDEHRRGHRAERQLAPTRRRSGADARSTWNGVGDRRLGRGKIVGAGFRYRFAAGFAHRLLPPRRGRRRSRARFGPDRKAAATTALAGGASPLRPASSDAPHGSA
jgi:hypothetical protein